VTGAGASEATGGSQGATLGMRRLCYSYDEGLTFVDVGVTLRTRSPQVTGAFPLTVAMSSQRRIDFTGEAIVQGDRVKLIAKGFRCEGRSDTLHAVVGGEGRAVVPGKPLPALVGREPWPFPPPTQGHAEFKLPRRGTATLCYLHQGGAEWKTAIGPDGVPIDIRVVSTVEAALAWATSSAPPARSAPLCSAATTTFILLSVLLAAHFRSASPD